MEEQTLLELGKCYAKKGELRIDLSSCSICPRSVSGMLARILKSESQPENDDGIGGRLVQDSVDGLEMVWNEIEQFLAYKYRTHHLELRSLCKNHCYSYAPNKDTVCAHY